jgi:hypothetical protein
VEDVNAMYKLEIAESTPNIMPEMKAVEKPVTAAGKGLMVPEFRRSLDRSPRSLVHEYAKVFVRQGEVDSKADDHIFPPRSGAQSPTCTVIADGDGTG